MAVTKIHPIKSTLKKALDDIENPDKTEDKMLVSSFGCSYETADIEFEMLLAQAIQKGNNLAHHLIQSFAPGEATPVQAHEIGKQLADEVLQGKYSYGTTVKVSSFFAFYTRCAQKLLAAGKQFPHLRPEKCNFQRICRWELRLKLFRAYRRETLRSFLPS